MDGDANGRSPRVLERSAPVRPRHERSCDDCPAMGNVIDLLEYPLYGLGQVDYLLGLRSGTARRWIEGYERRDKVYPPIIRVQPTGNEIVTWGEFVETRFLAEYRALGALVSHMRPAIDALRDRFQTKYPLAIARPFVSGKELVEQVQVQVGLEKKLHMVVIRNGQLVLSEPAEHFIRAVEWDPELGVVSRLRPLSGNTAVVVDPLRQFGEPVVRSVPTGVIAEQFDAGDSVDLIAELYELPTEEVEAALRYERSRSKAPAA